MPPDRLDAPSPGARASSTTTDRPARASVSAADNPAYPAPMIATSQLFGSATSVGGSRDAASHQYGSWESDPDSVRMFSPLSWSGNCMITGRGSLHLDPGNNAQPRIAPMLRIVIIGGGITGVAAAAQLAREGQAV